jgi:rubrerythrin
MMDDFNKQKLVSEFGMMKMIEQDAHDFYVKASQDRNVKDEKIRKSFSRIAEDELHHIELVDRIINIIRNCMCPVG